MCLFQYFIVCSNYSNFIYKFMFLIYLMRLIFVSLYIHDAFGVLLF